MPFQVQRKKHFLTWSCPINCQENPIKSKEDLLSFCKQQCDVERFSLACELHKDGKKHYHAYIEADVSTTNCRMFDYMEVHPNWITGVFARHVKYTQKFGDFITEGCEGKVNHFVEALKFDKSVDALNYLWKNESKQMCVNGHNIERNVKRKLDAAKFAYTPYYGPYRFQAPADWNSNNQTLLVTGDVGIGKTQWARWYCEHNGGYFYCKGSLECLKHYNGEPWIIYDDIKVAKYNFDCWGDVFDVMDGGAISARYGDIQIKPGVKKIWLQNPTVQIKDVYKRVLNGRRSFEVDYIQ